MIFLLGPSNPRSDLFKKEYSDLMARQKSKERNEEERRREKDVNSVKRVNVPVVDDQDDLGSVDDDVEFASEPAEEPSVFESNQSERSSPPISKAKVCFITCR